MDWNLNFLICALHNFFKFLSGILSVAIHSDSVLTLNMDI